MKLKSVFYLILCMWCFNAVKAQEQIKPVFLGCYF